MPFKGKTNYEKIELFSKGIHPQFSINLSSTVIDLLKQMLTYDQNKRPTIDQIFKHPWLTFFEKSFNINFSSLRNLQDVFYTSNKQVTKSRTVSSLENYTDFNSNDLNIYKKRKMTEATQYYLINLIWENIYLYIIYKILHKVKLYISIYFLITK